MNFLKYFICVICFVAIMSGFTVMAEDKVTFSGGKIIFPDNDSVPDANIANLTFNLDKVPPELKFMVGKIYRGYSTNQRSRAPGGKLAPLYLLLYNWNEEKMEFLVARGGGRRSKGIVFRLTCPSQLSQDFKCSNEQRESAGNQYRFSVKEGKPVLDATDGANTMLEEAALIPDEILKQTGK